MVAVSNASGGARRPRVRGAGDLAQARSQAELWERCRARVDRLDLPEPFTAEAFIDLLAHERARPIGLLPVVARPSLPCGLLVTTGNTDWIVYRADTTELHQQHILLHEAAHLLCEHGESGMSKKNDSGDGKGEGEGDSNDERTAMAAAAHHLMPHLPAELVRSVLGRTVYSEPDEREAELVASLILHRIGQRGRKAVGPASRPSSLDAIFGIVER